MGAIMRIAPLALLLFLLTFPLQANIPDVREEQIQEAVATFPVAELEEAIKLHHEGVKGDKKSVLKAEEILEKLHAQSPDNMMVQVYLGSIYTLRGRDIGFGPKALDYLKKGGRTMDAAVDQVPDDAHVRLVRAINYWNLPFFCGKKGDAEKDFLKLVEIVDQDPGQYDREMLQYIYYYAGLVHKDRKDLPEAVKLWSRAIPLQPASSVSVQIKRELQKVRAHLSTSSSSTKR